MFFGKFFKKNYRQLREKGDSLFAAERYADARLAYLDAQELVHTSADPQVEREYLANRLSKIGDRLAELNIIEAEAAFRGGEMRKGSDHLELALELADDVAIREKAANLLAVQQSGAVASSHGHGHGGGHGSHGCASCSSSHGSESAGMAPDLPEHLHGEEQFHLLVQTLPGDLPQRYEDLGEKFAEAYLLAHGDGLEAAVAIYQELLQRGESDILLCEIALLEYRLGRSSRCESFLKRAMALNGSNPLVHLGLAQFYIDNRRYVECIELLKEMLERQILHDQALLMLGDTYALSGKVEDAIDTYTRGLDMPALKKVSAERLVQILTAQNRRDEAAYLHKTYLKGCC